MATRPRRLALLAVEPVLLVVAASLPATRELVMVSNGRPGSGSVESVSLGPLFEAHALYS